MKLERGLKVGGWIGIGVLAGSLAVAALAQEEGKGLAVEIVAPADGDRCTAPADVRVAAHLRGALAGVHRVEFFANGHSLGVREGNPLSAGPVNPFLINWANVPAGAYALTAVATDPAGQQAKADPIKITVASAPADPFNTVTVVTLDREATEGKPDDLAWLKIVRAGRTDHTVVVFFELSGRALPGVDYEVVTAAGTRLGDEPGTGGHVQPLRTVTIPTGAESFALGIRALEDQLVEGPETVVVTVVVPPILAPPTPENSYHIGKPDRTEAVIQDVVQGHDPKPVAVIAAGSAWKYWDRGGEPGSEWMSLAFDDSGWKSGRAELGYGDGDEATVVSYGSDPTQRHISTYFRRAFLLDGVAKVEALRLRVLRDDGAAVYVNGREAFRSNLPLGPLSAGTLAVAAVAGADEKAFHEVELPPALLRAGRNVVAAEVHQASASSSDLSFDLELVGTGGFVVGEEGARLEFVRPHEGQSFPHGATIQVELVAIDPAGAITRVEFLANNVKIGESNIQFIVAPDPGTPVHHEFEWSGVPAGGYALTARAVLADGQVVVSPPVHLRVEGGLELPVVTVHALDSDAVESNPADFIEFKVRRQGALTEPLEVYYELAGTATFGIDYLLLVPEGGGKNTDPAGGWEPLVEPPGPPAGQGKVRFAAGAEAVVVSFAPVPDKALEGNEDLVLRLAQPIPPPHVRLRQTYRLGQPVEARGVIREMPDLAKASLEITAPKSGQEFVAPARVPIELTAVDPNGSIRRVEFFANGESIGVSEILTRDVDRPGWPRYHRLEWKVAAAGRYTLTATAADAGGHRVVAPEVTIAVKPALEPTLRIVAPHSGEVLVDPPEIKILARLANTTHETRPVAFYANDRFLGHSIRVAQGPDDPAGERPQVEHYFIWPTPPAGEYALVAKVTDAAGVALVSPPVKIVVRRHEPPVALVVRELPDRYAAGVGFRVNLHAHPGPAVQSYAVQDHPPRGWEVTGIGAAGAWDRAVGAVKFGPFLDGQARLLSYEVTPPPNAVGPAEFAGQASADGVLTRVTGDHLVWAEVRHPADRAVADNALSLDEVTAYGAAWRLGEAWPTEPNPIPIGYVTRAGALWRGGEVYLFEPKAGPAPLWWINPPQVNASGSPRDLVTTGFALRELPSSFTAGQPAVVTVRVFPAEVTRAFAVEEQLPPGTLADEISDEGRLDLDRRAIRWGPFHEAHARVLTYRLTATESPTPRSFAGLASFDGYDFRIASRDEPKAGDTRPQIVRLWPLADGSLQLTVVGELATPGYDVEVSTDLLHWTKTGECQPGNFSFVFADAAASGAGHRFYRVVRRAP
ncbi:MAG: hypothetical protein FJ387_16250 [Verrucomicrobia bacterium]|nr:hypothetical protein [Verrucomicrobiota bacterium]